MINWSLYRTTDPATEPITASDVEEKLVIDSGWDSTTLGYSIEAARQKVEKDSDRSLITQTYTLTLDKWPEGKVIYLPKGPYVSTTSFGYTDTNGDPQTLAVTTDYTIATNGDIPRITPISTGWPDVLNDGTKDVITIVYVVGYGNAAAVPGWAKEAILASVVSSYEGMDTSATYNAMISPNKVYFDYTKND